ncbi:MAG: hypothetical protein ACRDTD_22915 [Pseudonocardiaceae bacterium]
MDASTQVPFSVLGGDPPDLGSNQAITLPPVMPDGAYTISLLLPNLLYLYRPGANEHVQNEGLRSANVLARTLGDIVGGLRGRARERSIPGKLSSALVELGLRDEPPREDDPLALRRHHSPLSTFFVSGSQDPDARAIGGLCLRIYGSLANGEHRKRNSRKLGRIVTAADTAQKTTAALLASKVQYRIRGGTSPEELSAVVHMPVDELERLNAVGASSGGPGRPAAPSSRFSLRNLRRGPGDGSGTASGSQPEQRKRR